ncbi:MAG: zinc-dependent peptidase [Candidatus Eremiobacterota bacterium]
MGIRGAGYVRPLAASPSAVERRRAELARGMIADDTVLGAPPEPDQLRLAANLARVHTGALRFALREGLKFQVVRPGDPLNDLKVLRNQDLDAFRARLPKLAEFAAAVHDYQAGFRSGPLQDPEHRKKGRIALTHLMAANQMPLTVLRPENATYLQAPSPSDDAHVTLEQMAAVHGARTPAETSLFCELVEAINGPRLPAGRDVPLDPLAQTVLLPELYFFGPERDRKLLDAYDFDAVRMWQGQEGKVVDRHADPDEMGANGELFPFGGVNRILIRDRCLSGDRTAIHELAHGLDFLLESRQPEWYAGWRDRLERAHAATQQDARKAVTSYARANRREYLAEGMAFYFLEPNRLSSTDPELYSLVEEMLAAANRLGGVDPALEKAHHSSLLQTQEQVQRALVSARQDAGAAAAELKPMAEQLQGVREQARSLARVGLEGAIKVLEYAVLAGAVDAMLHHVLKQELTPERAAAVEKSAGLDPLEQALAATDQGQEALEGRPGALADQFDQGYLAGAALVYRMAGGPSSSSS